MKKSAGTLLYRGKGESLEVLLVHPSGNYNRNAPWGIPKGQLDPEEDFEAAARRETFEETGMKPEHLVAIGFITYTKSQKQIHCFAGAAPENQEPTCASWEVDKAEFLPIAKAKKLIHPDQVTFIDRLEELLRGASS